MKKNVVHGIFSVVTRPSLAAALAVLALAEAAAAGPRPARPEPMSAAAAFGVELARLDVRLDLGRDLDLMRRFVEPWVERPGEWRSFWSGRYGPAAWSTGPRLDWTLGACELDRVGAPREALVPLELAPYPRLAGPAISNVDLVPVWKLDGSLAGSPLFASASDPRCEAWQRPYSATVARFGGERETFRLLECDGSVALDAIDRLSVLARPPGVERPELPLPLEPDPASEAFGEWVPNVRMVDPRLVWVLARISEAFPHRIIYLISGYRRDGHGSFHRKGRALDLFVMGVPNEDVLAVCRKLKDVACGFYPNNKFLHVDVRPPGTGHAVWIDVSRPGEPSHYVDGWPGVIARGALAWGGAE